MCIYIYIYVWYDIYIYMHVYICIHIYIYIHIHTHSYIHMYVYAHMNLHVYNSYLYIRASAKRVPLWYEKPRVDQNWTLVTVGWLNLRAIPFSCSLFINQAYWSSVNNLNIHIFVGLNPHKKSVIDEEYQPGFVLKHILVLLVIHHHENIPFLSHQPMPQFETHPCVFAGSLTAYPTVFQYG